MRALRWPNVYKSWSSLGEYDTGFGGLCVCASTFLVLLLRGEDPEVQ